MLDPSDATSPLFATESFCPDPLRDGVGSADPVEFLDAAVRFANERLWGTLSAGLVVHPRTSKDPTTGAAVERAIASAALRHGDRERLVRACRSPSDRRPGARIQLHPRDIQSGAGWVHNTSMLEGIEKAVMRHPITAMPKPAYFAITPERARR